jgi:DNA polymerase
MPKKISKIITFYHENEIDEIYLEKTQNLLQLKNKKINNINLPDQKKLSNKNIIQIKSSDEAFKILTNNNQELNNKEALIKQPSHDEKNISVNTFISLNDIILSAKKLANEAKTINDLKNIVENFEGCNLKKMATNTVFCDGNTNSKIMVIGEAPGNHEDLEGIPFCGDSGELLNNIFKSINLSRSHDLYITNAIYWRPPGNRRPTEEELAICRPFVEKNIELLSPKIIILVGSTAMSCLLKTDEAISNIRGKILDYKPDFLQKSCKILTIFHPSYIMRQPSKKKVAWLDMINLKNFLESNYEN